jgi:methionyl-tRNA formyltransferase
MKILFLTNNPITKSLSDWLRYNAQEEITITDERISKAMLDHEMPVLTISYNYRYIIPKDILNALNGRVINLHISLLPWNRGADPNLWSFLEDTPKGVTIHLLEEGVDTGKILLQKEILFDEDKETLFSSYTILHEEIQKLFIENWQQIKCFDIVPIPQPVGGSRHTTTDFSKIRHILGEEGWNTSISEVKKRYAELRGQR